MDYITLIEKRYRLEKRQLALTGLCEVHYVHRRGTADGSLFRNLLNTIK